MTCFPVRVFFYKQYQLAIISGEGLLDSKSLLLLNQSLKKEASYINSWKHDINEQSVLWSYYKFMEAKFILECSRQKNILGDIILSKSLL